MNVSAKSTLVTTFAILVSGTHALAPQSDLERMVREANSRPIRMSWNGYDPVSQGPPPPPAPPPPPISGGVAIPKWTKFKDFTLFHIRHVVYAEHEDRVFIEVECFETTIRNGKLVPDFAKHSGYVRLKDNKKRYVRPSNIEPDFGLPSVSYMIGLPSPRVVVFYAYFVDISGVHVPGGETEHYVVIK
jgi:hypothetical protein